MSSHRIMPTLTEMLKECLVPNWGISMHPSERLITSCRTPFTSLPNIMAYLSVVLSWNCSSEWLFSVCSAAKMRYPSVCSFSTTSNVSWAYSQATEFSAPNAVLWISRLGGVAVMPHKYIFLCGKHRKCGKRNPHCLSSAHCPV